MDKNIETKLKRAGKAATDKIQQASEEIGNSAKTLKTHVRATSKAASKKLGSAKMQADKAAIETTRIITEHPLAAVAAAAAIGALAAGVLPWFLRSKRVNDGSEV